MRFPTLGHSVLLFLTIIELTRISLPCLLLHGKHQHCQGVVRVLSDFDILVRSPLWHDRRKQCGRHGHILSHSAAFYMNNLKALVWGAFVIVIAVVVVVVVAIAAVVVVVVVVAVVLLLIIIIAFFHSFSSSSSFSSFFLSFFFVVFFFFFFPFFFFFFFLSFFFVFFFSCFGFFTLSRVLLGHQNTLDTPDFMVTILYTEHPIDHLKQTRRWQWKWHFYYTILHPCHRVTDLGPYASVTNTLCTYVSKIHAGYFPRNTPSPNW